MSDNFWKTIWGSYRKSRGVIFPGLPFSRRPEGGTPHFFSSFFLPKVAKLANTNCQERFGAIKDPDPGVIREKVDYEQTQSNI